MTRPVIRYSVGNEHNPADPRGRSELVVHPDGSARLDHHFSMGGEARAWFGHVDEAALDEALAALGQAGFPPFPGAVPAPPGSTFRRLALEAGGTVQQGLVSWDDPALPPGYAGFFDLIDAVIR